MWPRTLELLIGVWLLVAPLLLPGLRLGTTGSLVFGGTVVALSLASFTRRLSLAHLATLLVALVMIGFPYLRPHPASAELQNIMICGLLLAMFAIIPSKSTTPPRSWLIAERHEALARERERES